MVADQFGAPTSAWLLAQVTTTIARELVAGAQKYDTFHVTATGATNWYEYAKRVVGIARAEGAHLTLSEASIHPIPTEAYPVPAPRPRNSRLDTSKLRAAFPTIVLPDWTTDVDLAVTRVLQSQTAPSNSVR
jgi:dTDP-4-dehydrorhamnose reductase